MINKGFDSDKDDIEEYLKKLHEREKCVRCAIDKKTHCNEECAWGKNSN